ncbi:transposase [Saccharothrix luteola]|uniref:transposase n=1 Tax=Saccharothrix luteola TaxID=2893018 RepID=UPI001E398AA4|nr:transposase [Saccharothrix luteola]MCC8247549.1 hypothetical protein [Saccharothrix luteola]
MRTHESTREPARRVEAGTARIRSATVTRQGERWFCSFSVEVDRADPGRARSSSAVGVDLGVTSLAVLSTGEVIANPKYLEAARRQLRSATRATGIATGRSAFTRRGSTPTP